MLQRKSSRQGKIKLIKINCQKCRTGKSNLVSRVLSVRPSRKHLDHGRSRVYVYKSNPHWGSGSRLNFVNSKIQYYLGDGETNCFSLPNGAPVLNRLQVALLSASYTDVILKGNQVICLEALYLRKDAVATLQTGYGNSPLFHVLLRLLKERDAIAISPSTNNRSVVLVASPSQTTSDLL